MTVSSYRLYLLNVAESERVICSHVKWNTAGRWLYAGAHSGPGFYSVGDHDQQPPILVSAGSTLWRWSSGCGSRSCSQHNPIPHCQYAFGRQWRTSWKRNIWVQMLWWELIRKLNDTITMYNFVPFIGVRCMGAASFFTMVRLSRLGRRLSAELRVNVAVFFKGACEWNGCKSVSTRMCVYVYCMLVCTCWSAVRGCENTIKSNAQSSPADRTVLLIIRAHASGSHGRPLNPGCE